MVDPDRVMIFKLDQKFHAFLQAVHKQHPPIIPNVAHQKVLALDPGETTGVAEYDPLDGEFGTIRVYQKVTKNLGLSGRWLTRLITDEDFDHVRHEDYRVYEWKAADHAWSPVHTIRWVGVIQYVCYCVETPNTYIMASHAKAFWTDTKLDMFGLNPKGLKHGRDGLRHLLYFLCFPSKPETAS